jgi:hypothetical protein
MEVSWSTFFKSLAIVAGLTLWTTSVTAGELYKPFRLLLGEPADIHHRKKPHTGKDHAVETLADQIDWLEAHIDAWGSVGVKKPDIWGEARLTKHRDEYERIMREELGNFKLLINASIKQSDAAYLMNSFALTSAATGTTTEPAKAMEVTIGDNVKDVTLPGISVAGFAKQTNDVGLEPTIQLSQMSRYLDHLHELRRIHEGDDTSDSPGYALNLVRIPVSIMPGKKTREGFGAEVTITGTPVLSDALMGDAFRDLVVNDLVDLLTLPALRFTELTDRIKAHERELKNMKEDDKERQRIQANKDLFVTLIDRPVGGPSRPRRAQLPLTPQRVYTVFGKEWLEKISGQLFLHYHGRDVRWAGGGASDEEQRYHYLDIEQFMHQQLVAAYNLIGSPDKLPLLRDAIENNNCGRSLARDIQESRNLQVLRRRVAFYQALARNSPALDFENINVSQLQTGARRVAAATEPISGRSLRLTSAPKKPLSPIEVYEGDRKTAQEEEAYLEGLEDAITDNLSTADLLAWHVVVEMALLNEYLHEDMVRLAAAKGCMTPPPRELPYYLPINCLNVDSPFHAEYLEASQVFQEYVRCRWPIHVFALDPVEQEQNVADALNRRRELQLALSLGFMNGSVNANNLTKFSRKLETEIQTISLNRTIVGFSHGGDTFGWRFMPRVQTPPPPGNVVAFGQTLFGGPSRDWDLSQRQIEPGMRECVAIVLMPSFVPYCDFDIRTDWFKLKNPKNSELSMRDTLELSRSIRAMQDSAAQCSACQHLYRDGEVGRLLKRVHQLDNELPLQTMRVQVPFENTLGGFEMFNTGMTDLAPELKGWYGAPGVMLCGKDCKCLPDEKQPACQQVEDKCELQSHALPLCPGEGTTLFLVGDNLSVHETRIIAGGVCIPHHRLISRGIIQVTIPNCVNTVVIEGKSYVDIHAATPYGITGHLHVPAFCRPSVCSGEVLPSPAKKPEPPMPCPPPAGKAAPGDSAARQPYLQSYQPGPLSLVARVTPAGSMEIDVPSRSTHGIYEVVNNGRDQAADAPAIWVALGDPRAKRLVTSRVPLKLEVPTPKSGNVAFNSADVAAALTPALQEMNSMFSRDGKDVEFDLVVYQSTESASSPQQVAGTAKMKLKRVEHEEVSLRPLPAIDR